MQLSSLLFVLLAVSVYAKPTPGDSNARRLAEGRPIKAPRKLYDGSKVTTAQKAKRSVQPGVAFTCGAAFAECCTNVAADNGSATGCDGNTSASNTCGTGTFGICCNTIMTGPPATGSDCFNPA